MELKSPSETSSEAAMTATSPGGSGSSGSSGTGQVCPGIDPPWARSERGAGSLGAERMRLKSAVLWCVHLPENDCHHPANRQQEAARH